MDDPKKNQSPDNKRINVNEDYERRDWAKKFGISEDKLRELVAKHGTSAAEVEKQLRNRS